MKRFWCAFVLAFVLGGSLGCGSRAVPLLPGTEPTYYALKAVVALGTVQSAAIGLNGIPVCAEAVPPAPPVCHPLLSDASTRIVVEIVTDSALTLKATPAGWQASATAALDRIDARLDAADKPQMKVYTAAARGVIALIGVNP